MVGMSRDFGQNGRRALNGQEGNQVRVVLPTMPVEKASLSDLKEQMRSASQAKAQVEAARARAAAEYSRRLGERATEKTLRKQSAQSSRNARAEVKVARKLKDLPDTRAAFEKGEITFGHAKVIAGAAGRADIDEQELVGRAKVEPVDVFARTTRRHEQLRSEDDGVSRLEAQKSSRRAWIKTDRDDGMTVLYARFDPITGAQVKNALSTRSDLLWRGENPKQRPSTEQRLADALADLICRPDGGKARQGGTGKWGGATLFIMADYDAVSRELRDASLADGTPIPVETLKDMACQARIVPAFFDSRNQPLWVGRGKRVATSAQRQALFARDRGCVGCNADPQWCQAHHIVPWQAGGPTDIDNLCLLCSRCHHQVHDDGWEIRQTPDGKHVMLPPARNKNRPPLPVTVPHRQRRRRKLTTKLRR